MTIQLPELYNHDEILRFLNRNTKECLHTIHGKTIFKALNIANELVVFSIDYADNSLIIKSSDDIHEAFIKKHITDWLDLDTPLSAFYKAVQEDEIMSQLCEKYKGLRMIGMPDLYESLVWSIIGQQINLSFAYSLKERLVKNFGQFIDYQGDRYYTLPKPATLASLEIEDFLPYQFSRQKAQYIINVSKAFDTGDIRQEDLMSLSFEEIREKLTKIKGVGNWTANYSMMKSLKFHDAFPVEDVGLQNAVRNQYHLSEKPTLNQLHEIAKKWQNWRGYATFYLWHSLLNE